MATTTIEVVNGRPMPGLGSLDLPGAVARQRELEVLVKATKDNPARKEERKALVAEIEAVAARIRELREEQKQENARRNFAGIGSPLHEALVARFDAATVAELEAEAVRRQAEREQRAAERRAKKGA